MDIKVIAVIIIVIILLIALFYCFKDKIMKGGKLPSWQSIGMMLVQDIQNRVDINLDLDLANACWINIDNVANPRTVFDNGQVDGTHLPINKIVYKGQGMHQSLSMRYNQYRDSYNVQKNLVGPFNAQIPIYDVYIKFIGGGQSYVKIGLCCMYGFVDIIYHTAFTHAADRYNNLNQMDFRCAYHY